MANAHPENTKPALRRVWLEMAAPDGSPKSLQEHVLFGITHLPSRWLPPDLPCLGGGFHCTFLDATGIEGQSRAGRSSTSISDDFGLRNSSLHLAWIGVRYRTMLYCVNTIQATALFPSIWPELSVLSGCPNLRRHHLQPATHYTLASAPSFAGKGTSYRVFFHYFTQAVKQRMSGRANPGDVKRARTGASANSRDSTHSTSPIVENLVSEMTYFALLQALHGEGMNAAIQDEDAATFFESELFKRQLSRLTQVWSGDPPISRAFGSRLLAAIGARCSIGLRTQPDILAEVPESRLRMAIKVGFLPRCIVGCHDPDRYPWKMRGHTYKSPIRC